MSSTDKLERVSSKSLTHAMVNKSQPDNNQGDVLLYTSLRWRPRYASRTGECISSAFYITHWLNDSCCPDRRCRSPSVDLILEDMKNLSAFNDRLKLRYVGDGRSRDMFEPKDWKSMARYISRKKCFLSRIAMSGMFCGNKCFRLE